MLDMDPCQLLAKPLIVLNYSSSCWIPKHSSTPISILECFTILVCSSAFNSLSLIHVLRTRSPAMNNIKNRTWNGSVNIRIVVEGAEYLLLAHRNLYFPLYFPAIVQFVSSVLGKDIRNVWLQYEDVPLKWNLPVGVLYDLLYLPTHLDGGNWTLVLRYETFSETFPNDDIIPFKSIGGSVDYESLLNEIFINHLKQSCYVMNGNSRAVMNLSEGDTKSLWAAILKHDYGVYTSIIKKILPKTLQRVPIKLYLAGSSTLIQAPVFPTKDLEKQTTLRDVLRQWLPDMPENNNLKAYIQGINVDVLYDVPIIDVWSTFCHLDCFLYIVVAVS